MKGNKLNEFYPLSKYKTLNLINLRGNCIKNIDELNSFIAKFNQLKEIDIKDNNIDFNDKKNENFISEVKKKIKINYL